MDSERLVKQLTKDATQNGLEAQFTAEMTALELNPYPIKLPRMFIDVLDTLKEIGGEEKVCGFLEEAILNQVIEMVKISPALLHLTKKRVIDGKMPEPFRKE